MRMYEREAVYDLINSLSLKRRTLFSYGGHSPLRMLPAAHVNTASGVRQ
jgi:hypothetical protein